MSEQKTFTVKVDPINLDKIAESGQVFRWMPLGPHEYGIVSGNTFCVARQVGENTIEIDTTEQDMRNKWHYYFDLETDYTQVLDAIDSEDAFLQHCAAASYGVRILRQDIWETMVSFIISQNNNIPRIKKTIETLCTEFGDIIETPQGYKVHAFPEPQALTDIGALQGIGLGYRDKYITNMAANVSVGEIDLRYIAGADYGHAFTSLCSIYGIGPKVANCIALFGAGCTGAFPVDTWINKIVGKYYCGKFPAEKYPRTAGILQQFMFYAVQAGAVEL